MELMDVVKKAINDVLGERILKYDVRSINPFVDDVVICSASNVRQVYAIAQYVKDLAKEHGYNLRGFEGNSESRWVLVDLDSVIVHVFSHEEREVFQLERLYADVPCEDITI